MERILFDDVDVTSGGGATEIDTILDVLVRQLLERLPLQRLTSPVVTILSFCAVV